MNSWEFLAALEKLNNKIEFPIYVTSSSIDPEDKQKTESHPFVKGFIEKPLTNEKIKSIEINK